VSTIVNSIKNGAFTPTLCFNTYVGIGGSISYNFGNNNTNISGYVGIIGVDVGFAKGTVGFSASATFDSKFDLVGGSMSVGVSGDFLGYGRANIGVGANFNKMGFTGIFATAGIGVGFDEKVQSYGFGFDATYTWNFNGENTITLGGNLNYSYAGWGGSGGVSYTGGVNNFSNGSWDWDLKGTYDPKQAMEYEIRNMQGAKLIVKSVITGDSEGAGKLGPGVQGYEEITWIDENGNEKTFTVDNVVWGTKNENKHPYDIPTNEGVFPVTYAPVGDGVHSLRIEGPESEVYITRGKRSAGCIVLDGHTDVRNAIRTRVQAGLPVYVGHSIDDRRFILQKLPLTGRPIYSDRNP